MTPRYSLLIVCITVCTINLIAIAAAAEQPDTNNGDFKTAVLDGYLKRCVEVLHSKGYSSEDIKAECSCELDYIEQNFAIFEQMLGNSAADNQQRINDFKKQLLQCKVKPHATQ
ncbi:hypothetical protein [Arsukibacterium indicum]|uniref:Uncharacterized protein n=1 Tax=Arsukibacterium indicum TaxID=2848612 RepID=A0ABS6MRT2_9GAMM|nr:hypothetical protein [Arsukibacterium indicum]MBV2131066.1 hypothetical protein [Arsukibacterium indicum]